MRPLSPECVRDFTVVGSAIRRRCGVAHLQPLLRIFRAISPTTKDDAMKTWNVGELAELPALELENRCQLAVGRIEERIARVQDEERDLTPRESDLTADDKNELSALKDAMAVQARNAKHRDRMTSAIDEVSRGGERREAAGELDTHFRNAETRALNGEGYRFRFDLETAELFERSTTTANAGAQHAAVVGASGAGIWLPRESGAMNANLPPGARLEAGTYGANTAVSATAEGADKPNLDPTLTTATVAPYAVSANVTIQSESAGRGIQQFTWAATRKVRRSVNDAFVAAMVTAGGSARAFAVDAPTSVDGAIAASMADTAATPSLVVCAETIFPALAQSGGDNARDSFPAYRGIRLVPSTVAALAGNALVIDGTGLTISLSGIEVRTQPQVISNSTDVVVEAWFAVVSHGASAVLLQDATTP